jgi:hypothetical protein
METMRRDHDEVRRFLLCEPRGHVGRHVNILVPSTRPDCDAGVIIMEPTEYVPMSGSNLICTVTVLLETGIIVMREPETTVTIDTPAGPVRAVAACRDGKCLAVTFDNVPSFVDRLDAPLEVEGFGTVVADIAFGGMFYALVDATRLGFALTADGPRPRRSPSACKQRRGRSSASCIRQSRHRRRVHRPVERPFAGREDHAEHLIVAGRSGGRPRHWHLCADGGAAPAA